MLYGIAYTRFGTAVPTALLSNREFQVQLRFIFHAARLYNVLFICHGLPGALALEDERGLMNIVSAVELAVALRDGDVQLAVINACYSAAGDEASLARVERKMR